MQDLVVAKHEIVIDVAKKAFVEIEVVKGSRRSILLKFFFVENGEKFDMQNVKLAEIKGTTPGGGRVFKDLDVLEDGSIEYLVSDTIVCEPGKTTCELQLIGPYGEVLVCHEISIKVLPNSFDENEYVPEDDISAVRAYVMRAEKAAETSEGIKEYVGKTTESYQMLEEELQQTKEEFENYTDTVKERIESGEFIGPPGIQGKQGERGEQGELGPQGEQGVPGESGIVTPTSGYFTLSVDEDGNVYANYADEDHPPQFEMDEEMNVYLLMDDDTKVFIGNVKPLPNQVQKAVNTYLEEHPVEEGKVDLPKTANGYDYGYAGQVAVGNGAGTVEWKNPEVKYYATLEEMLADEQLYNYMFAVVVGEYDVLDGRSATYFIYDKPVNGSVKLEKRELYACKIPIWYVSTNEQALTDGQKEQVRENIGAAAKADVEEKEKWLEEEILNLAIKPTTAPATSLHIQDSAKYRVLDIGMQGKTEQYTKTGAQLFDKTLLLDNGGVEQADGSIYMSSKIIPFYTNEDEEAGQYTMTLTAKKEDNTNPLCLLVIYTDGTEEYFISDNTFSTEFKTVTYITNVLKVVKKLHITFETSGNYYIKDFMVNKGATALPYEEYTGGISSPNKDFPQEIEHAGRYNVESGRYEIDVTVNNKNYFPTEALDVANWECIANNNTFVYPCELPIGDYYFSVTHQSTPSIQHYFYLQRYTDDTDKVTVNYLIQGTIKNDMAKITIEKGYKYRFWVFSSKLEEFFEVFTNFQIEKGTVLTPYIQPESQKVTLTPPRAFTKWDSLVKKDGWYYWEFKSAERIEDGTGKLDATFLPSIILPKVSKKGTPNIEGKFPKYGIYCNYARNLRWSNDQLNTIEVKLDDLGLETVEEFIAFLVEKNAEGNPWRYWYETEKIELIPVSQEEQAMLEALEIYYGVTNITNSEECLMQIQYVADTQLYVDNKVDSSKLSEADKQAFVTDVINALPTWQGGAY